MAILVLTVQASGQVYQRLGGTPDADAGTLIDRRWPAWRSPTSSSTRSRSRIAIALTTNQNAWRIWKTDFASSAPSYLLGAAAAAVVIAVTRELGLLADAAARRRRRSTSPTRCIAAGRESEARQGAILEAAHDAIITMDQQLNIREFNPAAEQMFGYARLDILGRNVGAAAAAGRSRAAAERAQPIS